VVGGTGYNPATRVATITPLSGLPPITNPVLIDGYSQPEASLNTLLGPPPVGSTDFILHPEKYGDNPVLKIQLESGLGLEGNNITVQGLVINPSPGPAIFASGANDVIRGNFLGTDVSGTQALGNAGADINTNFDTSQLRIGGQTRRTATSSPGRSTTTRLPLIGPAAMGSICTSVSSPVSTSSKGTSSAPT
jgi:hypothetical protein